MATALTAFATVADLSKRLKITAPTSPTAEYLQMEAALSDASDELRAITGQAINSGRTSVRVFIPHGGLVRLPVFPVITVHSVTVEDPLIPAGTVTEYTVIDASAIQVNGVRDVFATVNCTHGWATIPGEIIRWTCVLAAAYIAAADAGNLGLSGGLSSIGVDDGRVTFATNVGEQGEGITLPQRVVERLRASYGVPSTNLEHRP